MARIDGKPSRRRPGYTPEDVRKAQGQQAPRSSRGKVIAETRGVDRRVVGIAEALLDDSTIDEAKDRKG